MFILPYAALIVLGLFGSSQLKKAGQWWDKILDQAEPSTPVRWLKKLNFWENFDLYVILLMMAMVFFSHSDPDYESYFVGYENALMGMTSSKFEKIWFYIMRAGSFLGLTFPGFKMILVALAFGLIAWTIRKFVKDPAGRAVVWSLFLIFPALLDLVQLRFLLAQAILIASFPLMMKGSFKNIILYGLIVCLLSFFHKTAPVYLAFIPVWAFMKSPKAGLVFILAAGAAEFLIMRYLIANGEALAKRSREIGSYIVNGHPIGMVGFLVLAISMAALLFMCWKMMAATDPSSKTGMYFRLCTALCACSFLLIPLCLVDANFNRLTRPVWIMCYAAAGIWIYRQKSRDVALLPFGVPVKLYVLFWAVIANLYLISLYTFQINTAFLL